MTEPLEIFKKNVKRRLEDLGLTQKDLGQRLGITTSSVSQYLGSQGKAPGLHLVFEWAHALECSPADLISEPQATKPAETSPDSERLAIISLIISLDEKELPGVLAMLDNLPLQKQKLASR